MGADLGAARCGVVPRLMNTLSLDRGSSILQALCPGVVLCQPRGGTFFLIHEKTPCRFSTALKLLSNTWTPTASTLNQSLFLKAETRNGLDGLSFILCIISPFNSYLVSPGPCNGPAVTGQAEVSSSLSKPSRLLCMNESPPRWASFLERQPRWFYVQLAGFSWAG